jgi:hypothetical protein
MPLFCRFETITKIYVDGGYTGSLIELVTANARLYRGGGQTNRPAPVSSAAQTLDRRIHSCVAKPVRRLPKDYELLHESATEQRLRHLSIVFGFTRCRLAKNLKLS